MFARFQAKKKRRPGDIFRGARCFETAFAQAVTAVSYAETVSGYGR